MSAQPLDPATPPADACPRLLAPERPGLAAHLAAHGAPPYRGGPGVLTSSVEAAGLTGRGGAGFPTHRKLRAVAAGRRPVVVANAAEGEPASRKDRTLLVSSPHLVLDGLQLAAEAVGARRAHLYLPPSPSVLDAVRAALSERRGRALDRLPVRLVQAPDAFVAGEESAVAAAVSGRPALPRSAPPRVFESGVDGRATLVQNVETLAHLALIARYGPEWFRGLGTEAQPGTMLVTVSGAVHRPRVVETPVGTPVDAVLAAAGGPAEPVQAVLLGGYHGAWLPGDATATALAEASLRPHGAMPGAGVVVALPVSACGVAEAARVTAYLARESAGQCGPCMFGLPAVAGALASLARPHADRRARADLERWAGMLPGRGACRHPDGTVRFLRSSLETFAAELGRHERGRCSATTARPVLPVPGAPSGGRW